jgi:hypothetical protein
VLPCALDHKAGQVRALGRGGSGGRNVNGLEGRFFSYGFRHPLMLIENFFEHPRAGSQEPS